MAAAVCPDAVEQAECVPAFDGLLGDVVVGGGLEYGAHPGGLESLVVTG